MLFLALFLYPLAYRRKQFVVDFVSVLREPQQVADKQMPVSESPLCKFLQVSAKRFLNIFILFQTGSVKAEGFRKPLDVVLTND